MVINFFFFFSSRRRHTRFDCDWSSDVCSSDLCDRRGREWRGDISRAARGAGRPRGRGARARDRESGGEGKRGDLGGGRIIKKKKKEDERVLCAGWTAARRFVLSATRCCVVGSV